MTIIEDLNPSYSWGSKRLIFKFSLTSILFQFLLPNRLKLKDGTQTEIFSSLPPIVESVHFSLFIPNMRIFSVLYLEVCSNVFGLEVSSRKERWKGGD